MRESESKEGDYSLSVKEGDICKHYRIRTALGVLGYYITRRVQFRTLAELVNHYKYDSDGLCVLLTEPCKNPELPQTADLNYKTKDQVSHPIPSHLHISMLDLFS